MSEASEIKKEEIEMKIEVSNEKSEINSQIDEKGKEDISNNSEYS